MSRPARRTARRASLYAFALIALSLSLGVWGPAETGAGRVTRIDVIDAPVDQTGGVEPVQAVVAQRIIVCGVETIVEKPPTAANPAVLDVQSSACVSG